MGCACEGLQVQHRAYKRHRAIQYMRAHGDTNATAGFSVFVYDTYFEKVKESYGSVHGNVLDKTCSSTSISLIEISSLEPHRNEIPWNLCLNCLDLAKNLDSDA